MRILYANKYNYLKGGCERVLFAEMELMRSWGHQVAVFASRHPQNEPGELSDLFVEREDYFESSLWHKAKAALKIVYSLEALSKFGKAIDAFKPDVIHGHSIYTQLSTAVLDAAKKRKVPVVLTAHDYKIVCPSYLMLDHGKICEKCIGHHYYQCLLTRCHKENLVDSAVYTVESYFNYWFKKYDTVKTFICPSEFMRGKMLDRIPPEKLKVVMNPLDISLYPFDGKDQGYYLFVGRMSKEKGVGPLIRVFRELNLPLKLAGSGPLEGEYRKLAEGAANIQFLGFQSGKALEDLYRGAHACLAPSQWYENLGMVIMESLAYGKPVIGSRIGGIPELVLDGENGFLFDPFDLEDLKKKIIAFHALDPVSYGRFSQKARDFAVSHFSIEGHYGALMETYQIAMEPSREGR
jgi:glycosyltransferase involved in cell wall biosynthesis